jgi:uncharacterized protein (DUF2147 family)
LQERLWGYVVTIEEPVPYEAKLKMRGISSISAGLAMLLIGAVTAWSQPAGGPPDPTGEWVTAKGYAHIRIVDCGGKLWGAVTSEARPGGIDNKNPDRNLKGRPILGMPILLGMVQTKANRWDGQIYNSQDGNTYSASISLKNPDTLKVEGCFLSVLCGGEDWTRVAPSPVAQMPPNARSATSKQKNPNPPNSNRQNVTGGDIATESDSDVCLGLASLPGFTH